MKPLEDKFRSEPLGEIPVEYKLMDLAAEKTTVTRLILYTTFLYDLNNDELCYDKYRAKSSACKVLVTVDALLNGQFLIE